MTLQGSPQTGFLIKRIEVNANIGERKEEEKAAKNMCTVPSDIAYGQGGRGTDTLCPFFCEAGLRPHVLARELVSTSKHQVLCKITSAWSPRPQPEEPPQHWRTATGLTQESILYRAPQWATDAHVTQWTAEVLR